MINLPEQWHDLIKVVKDNMVRGEWSLPRISYSIKDPKVGLFTHTFSTDISIIPMAIKNNILFSNLLHNF